jgi:hypothetical protein
MTPTPTPAWQPDDLEAIRRALSIPVRLQALEAIAAAMAGLLQTHPGAIPSAQAELAAIGVIDQQLADLSPEQLQAPIEVRRNAAVAGAIGADGELPVSKADVIEYATDLLREEVVTRFQQPAPLDLLLHRQRASHGQALLLMLPSLAAWSRDPLLGTGSGGSAFQVAMARG